MKGTEKLIAHIRYEAGKKTDEILAQAETECSYTRLDYEQKARAAYTEKIRAGVAAEKQRLESMERFAAIEEKKALLAQRQALVTESFELAAKKLAALPGEERLAWLLALVKKTGEHGGEIILNAMDREALGKELVKAAGEGFSLSHETAGIEGGLILRRGSVDINCSIERMLDALRDEMSAEIAKILFG